MDEDDRALWESVSAWDRLPAYLPSCPLEPEELRVPYSLSRVQPHALAAGSLYNRQVEAMQQFYTDPPLTKPSKKHKPAMKALALSTLATRQRTLDEFVGFAVKWLAYEPTFELVMKPLAAAKFLGFLLARDCAISTLRRAAIHLSQAVTFVISEHCPGSKKWTAAWMDQVDDWYANLNSRLGALLASYPRNYISVDLTLWEAWEYSHAAWSAFKAAFQVGCCPAKRLPVRALVCTLDCNPHCNSHVTHTNAGS